MWSRPSTASVDTVRVKIADGEMASVVFGHRLRQAAQKSLAELIQDLRDCANVEDGHSCSGNSLIS